MLIGTEELLKHDYQEYRQSYRQRIRSRRHELMADTDADCRDAHRKALLLCEGPCEHIESTIQDRSHQIGQDLDPEESPFGIESIIRNTAQPLLDYGGNIFCYEPVRRIGKPVVRGDISSGLYEEITVIVRIVLKDIKGNKRQSADSHEDHGNKGDQILMPGPYACQTVLASHNNSLG